jgi:triphosphatase
METELKLRFNQPDGQADFLADTWVCQLVLPDSRTETDMHSQYYDTQDHRLTNRKMSLRVRREGDDRIATVKSGNRSRNGLHQRLEWSVRLGENEWPESGREELDIDWFLKCATSDGDPDDVLQEIMHKLEGQPLVEICQARFKRTTFAVGYGDTLMELCLDDGELIAGERTEPINEIELELKEGDVRDLVALGDELTSRFDLSPENKSKYARCLALLKQEPSQNA